jgi:hypothetical protein
MAKRRHAGQQEELIRRGHYEKESVTPFLSLAHRTVDGVSYRDRAVCRHGLVDD